MDVCKVVCKRLTNYEVLQILKELKEKKQQKGQGQLATICYETTKYLETHSNCSKQTPERIVKCHEELKEFPLKPMERFSILNLQPKTALEIQLIVDSGEDRLTEDQVEKILKISNSSTAPPPEEEETPKPQ